MKIENHPIFKDYVCPTCGIITSKWCTKLLCDCHKKEGEIIIFGGIWHFPPKKVSLEMESDD